MTAAGRSLVRPADDALLVVDVQNGFITQRDELPVVGGAEVVPIINGLLPLFAVRVATQDWHPPGHGSFASAHPGARPFQLGTLAGLPQIYWPDHCVQGTHGAELHPELRAEQFQAVIRKGYDPAADSYSAFSDNAGRNPTGLDGYLRARGVKRLYIAGLTLDYCVHYSALDARRLLPDVAVYYIVDATRPVARETGREAEEEMARAGVARIASTDVLSPPGP